MPNDPRSRCSRVPCCWLGPAATLCSAQGTGRVIGRVVEGQRGAPVAGATVEVVGRTVSTVTAVDGRYTLERVPAGPVSLRVRMIGYGPKAVTGVVVPEGGSVAPGHRPRRRGGAARGDRGDRGSRARHGEPRARRAAQRHQHRQLDHRRADQKSPDSDAGQAVQRVSGVTVQDGKYVFVRGLGERYTTTSLNGARIPSPEPERKVVPLDLFPAEPAGGDHHLQDLHAGSVRRLQRRVGQSQDARVPRRPGRSPSPSRGGSTAGDREGARCGRPRDGGDRMARLADSARISRRPCRGRQLPHRAEPGRDQRR